jgi:hypothetical protein
MKAPSRPPEGEATERAKMMFDRLGKYGWIETKSRFISA